MDNRPVLRWEIVVAALIVVLDVGLSVLYVGLNHRPPAEDGPFHVMESFRFWRGLTVEHEVLFRAYPPIPDMAASATYSVLGPGLQTACLSLCLFSALYLVGMMWIGRLCGGRIGGVVMGLGAGCAPLIATWNRTYIPDLAVLSAVAMSLAALIGSSGFTRPFATVALGLALAFGMLARWTFPYFIAAPLLMVVVHTAWRGRARTRRAVLGAIVMLCATAAVLWMGAMEAAVTSLRPDAHAGWRMLALTAAWTIVLAAAYRARRRGAEAACWNAGSGVTIAIATGAIGSLWWYCLAGGFIYRKILMDQGVRAASDMALAARFAEYARALAHVLPMTLYLAAIGVVLGLSMRRLRAPTLLALAGTASSLAILLATDPRPNVRYEMPAAVFVVLVCMGWLACLSRGRSWIAVPAVGTLLAANFLINAAWLLPPSLLPLSEKLARNNVAWEFAALPQSAPPDSSSYPLEEALELVRLDNGREVAIVKRGPAGLEREAFEMAAALHGIDLRFDSVEGDSPPTSVRHVILVRPIENGAIAIPWLPPSPVRCWQAGDPPPGVGVRWCLFRMDDTPAGTP